VNFTISPVALLQLLHLLIVIVIMIRVIMRRPAIGVALAWLMLVAAVPYGGALIYLVIGERRIGDQRRRRIDRMRSDYLPLRQVVIEQGIASVDWERHGPAMKLLNRLGYNLVGMPTVRESHCEILSEAPAIFKGICEDIDDARHSVLMEFYIWNEGGRADDVLAAVIRAAKRGVSCRVLIDAVGASPWWKGAQPQQMRDAGVQLEAALPVGLFRTFVGRTDLRIHRKIVVVDAQVAWTGSMNLVDPLYFKQDAGVGEWVDAMVRLKGSVIIPLVVTMIGDWSLETGEPVMQLIADTNLQKVVPQGTADIQVIPSGPGTSDEGLLQMILGLINSARSELVLTTPYLVSFFARYAGRSYFDHLLDAGIEVYQYQAGLLHTKSMVVDGRVSMFGTANLDMRSLWLNYELSLFIYDSTFATELRELQQQYIDDSQRLDEHVWASRPLAAQFLENLLRLMSPLL